MTFDVTPLSSGEYFDQLGVSSTPFAQVQRQPPRDEAGGTPFSAYPAPVLLNDGRYLVSGESAAPPVSDALDPMLVAMGENRVALLEHQAIYGPSNEDEARFRILTDRMRRLQRTFHHGVLEAVEQAADLLEESQREIDQISAELGLT